MNIPDMQPFIPQMPSSFEQKKSRQQPQRTQTPPPLSPQLRPSKHISFNTEVEEIEPSDDENDEELDAEIAEELKELEEQEETENEDETDLKIDE
jgi:hypothetical protein